MIRAPDQKVVFFHNPKAAGSSISKWFLTNIPGSRHVAPQHILPRRIAHEGWSFCVIRNPWDRWVSWWCYWHDKLKRIDTPFEEYTLRYFSGEYDGLSGGEYSSLFVQHDMASDVDYIIRYENLSEDFKIVQEKLNCFERLPLHNSNTNRKPYSDYYTSDELIKIVADFHRKDIEEYGYEYAV